MYIYNLCLFHKGLKDIFLCEIEINQMATKDITLN